MFLSENKQIFIFNLQNIFLKQNFANYFYQLKYLSVINIIDEDNFFPILLLSKKMKEKKEEWNNFYNVNHTKLSLIKMILRAEWCFFLCRIICLLHTLLRKKRIFFSPRGQLSRYVKTKLVLITIHQGPLHPHQSFISYNSNILTFCSDNFFPSFLVHLHWYFPCN